MCKICMDSIVRRSDRTSVKEGLLSKLRNYLLCIGASSRRSAKTIKELQLQGSASILIVIYICRRTTLIHNEILSSCWWTSPFLKSNDRTLSVQRDAVAFNRHFLHFSWLVFLRDFSVDAVLGGKGFFDVCAVSLNVFFLSARDVIVFSRRSRHFYIWIELRTNKIIELLQAAKLADALLSRLQFALPSGANSRVFLNA